MTSRPPEPPTNSKPKMDGQSWRVRTPMTFFDCRKTKLTDRQMVLLQVLDGIAGGRTFSWAGNQYLATATGKGVRAIQLVLDELEGSGGPNPCKPPWIKRIHSTTGRPSRLGIVMLKRVDPDFPAASNPAAVAAAEKALRSRDPPVEGVDPCALRVNDHAPLSVNDRAPSGCRSVRTELEAGNQTSGNETILNEIFRPRSPRSEYRSRPARRLTTVLMDQLLKEEAAIQGACARPVAHELDDVEPFG